MRYYFEGAGRGEFYCLTNEHSASSYGQPVIVKTDWTGTVVCGQPIGRGDDPTAWDTCRRYAETVIRGVKPQLAWCYRERDRDGVRDLVAMLRAARWALASI